MFLFACFLCLTVKLFVTRLTWYFYHKLVRYRKWFYQTRQQQQHTTDSFDEPPSCIYLIRCQTVGEGLFDSSRLPGRCTFDCISQIRCKKYNFIVDFFFQTGKLFPQGVNKSTTLKRPLNRLSKTVETYLGLLRNNTSSHTDRFSLRLRPRIGVLSCRVLREHDFFIRAYRVVKTFWHK